VEEHTDLRSTTEGYFDVDVMAFKTDSGNFGSP